jgi:Uma2 family endonuclease
MKQQVETVPLIATRPLPPGKISYEQFLEWLDDETHAEWVEGEVVLMSPVSKLHQRLTRLLLNLISFFVEAHELGEVFFEPFIMKTAPDLPGRAPDILFVANSNLGRLKQASLEGPADLVIETVSPDRPDRDWVDKRGEYEQGGVREYWIIDPQERRAGFYHLGENGRYQPIPISADGMVRSIVLEGLWLKVEWLWQEPLPLSRSILSEWGLI